MIKSDMLRNMRGGVIYQALLVQNGTARAWVANNNLSFGKRANTVQPRYDLADGAKIVMMRELTRTLGLTADSAASIVNEAADAIQVLADGMVSQIDNPAAPANFEYRILVCTRAGQIGTGCAVLTIDEHIETIRSGGLGFGAEIVADLLVITAEARDAIIQELTSASDDD